MKTATEYRLSGEIGFDQWPIVIEDFLNQDDLNYLLQYSQNSEELYNSFQCGIDFWDKRAIPINSMSIKRLQNLIVNSAIRMRDIINYNNDICTDLLYAEYPQFAKWDPDLSSTAWPGWDLPPHCDNCEPDGITPNLSPGRSHGAVIYLNDDFEGGEIIYPKLNIEIKPKPGMMVIHPAGLPYLHGIKKVSGKIRHTISVFFTYDSTATNLISDQHIND